MRDLKTSTQGAQLATVYGTRLFIAFLQPFDVSAGDAEEMQKWPAVAHHVYLRGTLSGIAFPLCLHEQHSPTAVCPSFAVGARSEGEAVLRRVTGLQECVWWRCGGDTYTGAEEVSSEAPGLRAIGEKSLPGKGRNRIRYAMHDR